jgi:hypothetical protein
MRESHNGLWVFTSRSVMSFSEVSDELDASICWVTLVREELRCLGEVKPIESP